MEDSRVKQASSLLEAFFDKKTLAAVKNYAGFVDSWPSIAGPRLADHSRPVDIRHGTLVVETEHSGWIQLIRLEQERMLREIKGRFPELEIEAMSIRLEMTKPEKEAGLGSVAPGEGSSRETPGGVEELSGASENLAAAEEPEGKAATNIPPELKIVFERLRKNIKAAGDERHG